MQKEEITAIFDQQAATYDQKWSELAPIKVRYGSDADETSSDLCPSTALK
jgi:hypothetical protein